MTMSQITKARVHKMVFRIVARLDVKPPLLVKGIHLEGFKKVGIPNEFAERYYAEGVDEISYQDVVATLYGFNSIADLISNTAEKVFLPITVGGGIRSIQDGITLLQSGADKICVNTAAVIRPELISELAKAFGQQAIVVGIEAKKSGNGWVAMTHNGREKTKLDVVDWSKRLAELGAGEILLTSVDCEGTGRGFDLDLIHRVKTETQLSVIAHGGMGSLEHALMAKEAGADGIAVASVLHWRKFSVTEIKEFLRSHGVTVRTSQ